MTCVLTSNITTSFKEEITLLFQRLLTMKLCFHVLICGLQ